MLTLFLFGIWGGPPTGIIVHIPLAIQVTNEAMVSPQVTGEKVIV